MMVKFKSQWIDVKVAFWVGVFIGGSLVGLVVMAGAK